jgi:hypothetical protein
LNHYAELDLANMLIAYQPLFIAELGTALEGRSRIREHPWTYPKGLDGTGLSQVCWLQCYGQTTALTREFTKVCNAMAI